MMRSVTLLVMLCLAVLSLQRQRISYNSRRFKRLHSQFTLNRASIVQNRLKKTCKVGGFEKVVEDWVGGNKASNGFTKITSYSPPKPFESREDITKLQTA